MDTFNVTDRPRGRASRTPSPGLSAVLRDTVAVLAGRVIGRVLRIARPDGGSVLPGSVANFLSPGLLARVIQQPRDGIVAVTGSTGRSTTTGMVAAILRQHGLSVFTNFYTADTPDGLMSQLLPGLTWHNRLSADIAVLNIDEKYSATITEEVPARVSILLNIVSNQLRRGDDTEQIASSLKRTAASTVHTIVVNADDPRLAAIGAAVERRSGGQQVRQYGVAAAHAHSQVVSVEGTEAAIRVDDLQLQVSLPSEGAHIASGAAAAIEGARALLGTRFDSDSTRDAFLALTGVAGRTNRVTIAGHTVDLIFTKSPASMQLNLDLLDATANQVMVAVGNDSDDTSQLWLVDWSALPNGAVVSGWAAWDTALRLAYDEVAVGRVEPDIRIATRDFIDNPSPPPGHSTIIYTPDTMRPLRPYLQVHRGGRG